MRAAATMLVILATTGAAHAQGVHWPRQHAEPPLSESFEGALPPPSPVARGEHGPDNHTGPSDHDGGYTYEATGFEARISADGRVVFHDRSSVRGDSLLMPTFLFAFGTMDVTDLVMRRLGQDPYSSEKRAFLESTFETRARMRMRFDESTMETALAGLPSYLGRVWRYQPWDAALRKPVLFALWDECAENGNQLMREGGAEARRLIEEFVQSELPPGTAAAFTAVELEALNQRRTSERVFAPYRAEP